MKVSLVLLKKFIALDQESIQIADALTLLGLEVDSIDCLGQNLENVIAVEITNIEKHPRLNKVQVLSVESKKKKYTIVCADLTVFKGQITALAPIGATIYPKNTSSLKITKREFAKIESQGMLCSEQDLGISNDNSAIINLTKADLELDSIQPLFQDTIFDISLTPNLGHCRSILGVARELGAHYNRKLNTPLVQLDEDTHVQAKDLIQVQNNYPQGALQYYVRVIKNVSVTESRPWLKKTLQKLGYKSVNNVVDCLNFTMHMLGQPLHGFDLDAIEGKALRIERAKGREIMSALNHKDYKLSENSIMICDQIGPICIAGIIGNERTSVKEKTQHIVIEAAQFCPHMIRKTAKNIGFRSDSSNRFENQIDPMGIELALNYACNLIKTECTGCICKGIVSQNPSSFHPKFLNLRLSKIQSIIGISLSASEVEAFLKRLSMPLKYTDGIFQVRIPSYRNDLKTEIDLVEEVLRLYGYNNIKKVDLQCTLSKQQHHTLYTFKRAIAKSIQRLSFTEIVNCNLISEKQGALESRDFDPNQSVIRVLHAKSQDQSILRPSLLTGFLNTARINQRQAKFDLRLYEIGHTYLRNKEEIQEHLTIGLLLSGELTPFYYNAKPRDANFFTLKGVLENLFKQNNLKHYTFVKSKSALFHPHQQTQIFVAKESIGLFGRLHPKILETYGCKGPIYYAQINTQHLLQSSQNLRHFTPLTNNPCSQRDLTIQTCKSTPLSQLENKIKALQCSILESYELIAIFEPKETPDKHNITFRFTYRDKNKTLLDDEIQSAHTVITQNLEKI